MIIFQSIIFYNRCAVVLMVEILQSRPEKSDEMLENLWFERVLYLQITPQQKWV